MPKPGLFPKAFRKISENAAFPRRDPSAHGCGLPIVAVLDVPDVPSADPQRLAALVLELTELITGTPQGDRNLVSGLLQHHVVPYFVGRPEDNCARHLATVPPARSYARRQ